ncbi:MAG: peptide chain release factor N(5)-glutamine methyltransferase [Elusimicrobia bacterium]|nr:peptide chain release factor N(5)-glutamine methyltransferase [Elusimicrobiota bacterium]
MPTFNIFEILKIAEKFLTSHNITEAKLDAEVMLCDVLNIERKVLPTIREKNLTAKQYSLYQKYLERRANREPVSYIIGNTEFMGLKFKVSSDVLIPRQETEILVETVNNFIKKNNCKNILDLCTGSGCIAVSVAKYNKDISVTASDISEKALNIAKENAELNKVSDRINFVQSNIFESINEKFDIIVSNPPYVTEKEYKTLEKELYFEPKLALTAEDNGLYFYKQIAENAKKYLNNNGAIFLELNANLSKEIESLFKNFSSTKIIKDYSGLPRILQISTQKEK